MAGKIVRFRRREPTRPGGPEAEAAEVLAAGMSERELSQQVYDLARKLGWKAARYPTWSPTHTEPGFPDLVLARRFEDGARTLIFAELKAVGGRLSAGQKDWLEILGLAAGRAEELEQPCDVHVVIWTPREWFDGTIERALR